MSYLDNTTITVDAVLTKKGRERFSQGNFNVTQFALADDEIDYGLYNVTHPSGSDYYAIALENLPLLEAIPDDSKTMKFKLITLPKGTAQIPVISTGISTLNMYGAYNGRPGQTVVVAPSTVNGLNNTLGYTATLDSPNYVTLAIKEAVSVRSIITPSGRRASTLPGMSSVVGKSFTLTAKALPQSLWTTGYSTRLSISGNETGGLIIMTINVYKDVKTANEY